MCIGLLPLWHLANFTSIILAVAVAVGVAVAVAVGVAVALKQKIL